METTNSQKQWKAPKECHRRSSGFTLVELLAVIVILAIILIIAVPGVLSIIDKTKNNAYDRQIDMIKDATRNYITANTIAWTGDSPKSTVVTLDMLQSGGYLDKKLIDPRDKSEILCANFLVIKDNKNKITYDVDMACNETQPITPRVGSGMIPIVYNGTKWVKADVSNKDFAWFNYGNRQWANAATVTEDARQTLLDAPVGTVVPMDQINGMYTWIPRFKYKLFNVDGSVSPIGNPNMLDDYLIDIKFETANTTKSTGSQNGEWLTHPAFTFGGQELDGFWMAKFETGRGDATNATEAMKQEVDPTKLVSKPNQYSWRLISISNMYQNIQKMKDVGSFFGITNQEDPHMMRNMEWGAVTYLTQSNYGKQGNPSYRGDEKTVVNNNNSSYITGCGANTLDEPPADTCNTYETSQGQSASTTGNISGVYDTSGGAWDYVATAMSDSNGTDIVLANGGFELANITAIVKEGKYMDVYPYSESWLDRSRSKLGDAILEMGPFQEDRNAWYGDYSYISRNDNPWIARGGGTDQHSASSISGITASTVTRGGGNGLLTGRVVLI